MAAILINKNMNKITLVLLYAALEMFLIVLLFLNGFLSYLITKFADYFRLKRPCVWCSRIDHILEPGKFSNSCRFFICDEHAMEISKLGYCLDHKKLAELQVLCADCLSSCRPSKLVPDELGFQWGCSCCGASLENNLFFPDCNLISGISNESVALPDDSLLSELRSSDKLAEMADCNEMKSISASDPIIGSREATEGRICADLSFQVIIPAEKGVDDVNGEILCASSKQDLEYIIDTEDCHLIPVELDDSDLPILSTNNDYESLERNEEPKYLPIMEEEDDFEEGDFEEGDFEEEEPFLNQPAPLEMLETEQREHAFVDCGSTDAKGNSQDAGEVADLENENENEDEGTVVSIKGEIPEALGAVDDGTPETPTSVDSFHHLQKKLVMLERRESCTEDSIEGSMVSDIETGDAITTIEKLKSALRTERKALQSLYAELEEERNASAVAANQTMAMINRLQEEKAAMQMEALHYQRMMDEQTEYDQEALQLLNELMVKREKEKDELERELEFYRAKVESFEARERSMKTRNSCSNSDGGESADSFEDERVSILEQLKLLEGKLFMAADVDENEHKMANGNGLANGHAEPGEDEASTAECKANSEQKTLTIEEEVEHVAERVNALEADREFLKHCVLSLRKEGKGVELLHEILQHLRELRSVELRVRTSGDGVVGM